MTRKHIRKMQVQKQVRLSKIKAVFFRHSPNIRICRFKIYVKVSFVTSHTIFEHGATFFVTQKNAIEFQDRFFCIVWKKLDAFANFMSHTFNFISNTVSIGSGNLYVYAGFSPKVTKATSVYSRVFHASPRFASLPSLT